MKTTQQDKRTESIKVQINGIPVTLFFAPEPNREAADFIKKTLINAYVIRTA
jgi:hypothetical protein